MASVLDLFFIDVATVEKSSGHVKGSMLTAVWPE